MSVDSHSRALLSPFGHHCVDQVQKESPAGTFEAADERHSHDLLESPSASHTVDHLGEKVKVFWVSFRPDRADSRQNLDYRAAGSQSCCRLGYPAAEPKEFSKDSHYAE